MKNASYGTGSYQGGTGVTPNVLAALTYGGRTGWRYPDIGELAAALNSTCSAYFIGVQNAWYNTQVSAGYTGAVSLVWVLNPVTKALSYTGSGGNFVVWPVRSGR